MLGKLTTRIMMTPFDLADPLDGPPAAGEPRRVTGPLIRSVAPWFAGVGEGVFRDVGDVVVGEVVDDFAAAALGGDEAGGAQGLQVLRDEGLRDREGVDELVDAAWGLGE
jgi:hypothetical protein